MSENKPESLFYEYAITPDVFDAGYIASDLRLEVILVELLKGICDNGMIVNLNGLEWKNTINDRLEILSTTNPDLKKKISDCLTILDKRNRLVYHHQNGNLDSTSITAWLNIASLTATLDGIIVSHKVIERSGLQDRRFINALEALDSNAWSNRRRTLTLKNCHAYYDCVLEPILRHASSLTIVDPYFSPDETRFVNFLKLCIEHMGKRGCGDILHGRIIIHAGDPEKIKKDGKPLVTIEQREHAWEEKLKEITGNSPHEFRVYLRKRKYGGAKFHDRFILTDQCCIAIPLGTDTDSDDTNTTTTWCLLDHKDLELKNDEISPERNIFKVLGGVIKDKNGKFEKIKRVTS